ncbi:unnamed protein product, partial [Staurois parvus]
SCRVSLFIQCLVGPFCVRQGGILNITSALFLWGWELLCDWPFLRYCLAITLINAAYFVPYVHLVAHMRVKEVGERHAAILMSLVGIADVFGRLIAGWLADLTPKRILLHLSFWTGSAGLVLGLLPLAWNEVGMGMAAVVFGFCAGALTPGVFSCLPWVVGTEKVLPAIGLLQMVESVGGLLGPPISGWLRDWSGDFSLSFIICGLLLLLGAIIILTLPGVLCRTDQSETRNQSHQIHIPNAKDHLMSANGTSWPEQRAEQPLAVEYKGGANLPPHVMSSSVEHLCLNTANMEEQTKVPRLENDSSSPSTVTSSHTTDTVL